jgi:hypothetical protein
MSLQSLEGTSRAAVRSEPPLAERLAQVVAQTPLRSTPCDHIYMENVFSADFYRQLLANFPPLGNFHPLYHHDAVRPDGTSTRQRLYLYPESLWRLPPVQRVIWRQVATALCSDALQTAFKRKFQAGLEDRFQRPVDQVRFYPVPILVRGLPGYRIGIHADTLTKAVTVQFYLPSDASQVHLGTVFHTTKKNDGTDQPVAMQFLPSSGYAFAVRKKESWHSVPQTTEADGERRSIMLTYYVDEEPRSRRTRRLQRLGIFFGRYPKY